MHNATVLKVFQIYVWFEKEENAKPQSSSCLCLNLYPFF